MNKTELRNHLRKLRMNLSDTERLVLSQRIYHRLEEIDWSIIRNLHCFEPIAKLGEVNISAFMSDLQTRHPKIELYTSRYIDGTWKIVSWEGQRKAPPLQFDAVIVPMLGFDTRLQRIGYGGGYYDKFLATQPQARKIGICFELGKITRIPNESHDIPLDSITTESQTYLK
jgi:5-formyltetrahydrofolate cyclo-ligase